MSFYVMGNTNNNLAAGVIQDPTDQNTFQQLFYIDHIADEESWGHYMVDFSTYTGEGGRIAFKGGVIYAFDFEIYIDNIEVSVTPTCSAGLTASATLGPRAWKKPAKPRARNMATPCW